MSMDNWRAYWLVRNIGGELPFIGPFLREKDLSRATEVSLKSTFMLMGGITFMITDPFNSMSMENSPIMSDVKMSGGMVVGMMSGSMAYNVLRSVGKSIYSSTTTLFNSAEKKYYAINNAEPEEGNNLLSVNSEELEQTTDYIPCH